MNPILAYEQAYITLSELEEILWDMGQNQIYDVGENCFAFYCSKINKFHKYEFYIRNYGSDINDESEWYCE